MTTLSRLLERHGRGLPWDIALAPNPVARVARSRLHLIAVAVSVVAAPSLVSWLAVPPGR